MEDMLKETRWLYNNLLEKHQKYVVDEVVSRMNNDVHKDILDKFWRIDEEIGGIGGYNMPRNPVMNPFPGGDKRSLYRPLQYAACELERNLGYGSRYVIQFSGMHLEAAARTYIASQRRIKFLPNFNSTLGKLVHEIDRKKTFDVTTIQSLFQFIKLFNLSKHEVNQNESRMRLFSEADAMIAYLSSRKLGMILLLESIEA